MNLSVGKLEQKNLILNGVQGWAYLYLNISSGEYIKRNQHVCFESFSVRRRFSNAASWLNGFIAETGSSWLTGLDLLIFELVVRKLWSMKIFIVSYDYVEEHERFTDRTNRWVWFHSTKSLCLSLLSKKAFLGWILGFMCSAAFLLRWKHAHVFHCSFLLEEVCLQFPPSIVSTALCGAMSRVYSTQSHERFMDETCRGNHDWVFQLDAEYKRAPGGGIIYCSQCGCFNEQMSRCKLKPKVSVNTRLRTNMRVDCFGNRAYRDGGIHSQAWHRVQFVHEQTHSKFSGSCINWWIAKARRSHSETLAGRVFWWPGETSCDAGRPCFLSQLDGA